MKRKAIAALTAALVAGCSGEVRVESTNNGSSGGTGGTGGAGTCSVSLPADCDCPGKTVAWAQAFSVAGNDKATDIWMRGALPIAPDGSMTLHIDTSNVNGNSYSYGSSRLVKLDAAGHVRWEIPEAPLFSPTPDPRDCSTVVTGVIAAGATDLLGETVSCSTARCPFVARLDAAGSLMSIKVYDFGGDGLVAPWVAGVLADGRIALVGAFEGTIDLGDGPLTVPPYPSSGIFAALLEPSGEVLWSRHLTQEHTGYEEAVAAVSPAGDIIVATSPNGAVDFGAGFVPEPGAPHFPSVAVAAYDAVGTLRFGKLIGYPSDAFSFPSLALDSAGRVIIAQAAVGTMDFGGGPIGTDATTWLAAVAAFDADGQHLWSTGIDAEPALNFGVGLAVDGADHVWVGADSLLELDPGGALLAAHPLGGFGKRHVSAIGFGPGGVPIIAGTLEGTIDLGQGLLSAQSKQDVFVAALAP